jgi:hypothetical protein
VITSKQLKREARKSRPVYLDQMLHVGKRGSTEGSASLVYATNEEISSPLGNLIASKPQYSATLQSLLEQYSDVFPDDLPHGLPPERCAESNISLEPDAKPVKRPIYKLSPAELKEVKTQIDDLLEKGFILPSTNPWVSSILFVPKRMGDSVCAQSTGPSIKLRFETITRILVWMKFRTKSWFSLFIIS